MKKLLLPILVGASMSFAANGVFVKGVENDYTCNRYSPDFRISNDRDEPINGFKIYAYFSTNDVNAKPFLASYAKNMHSPMDMKKLTNHVWRVVIDYTNKVIPARGVFPGALDANAEPSIYSKYFSVSSANEDCLDPYPQAMQMKDIVIESASGQVLAGKHPDYKSRVGVLGYYVDGCPDGKQSLTYIALDAEDNNNKSRVVSGPKPKRLLVSDDGDVQFFICPALVRVLPRTTYDYMVLKLDENCPDGTYPVRRHHDAEDSNTKNYNVGSIWPNKVVKKKDVDLEFCFVPKTSNHNTKFPFGTKYSVFANPTTSIDQEYIHHIDDVLHSEIFIDDEDHNNENSWFYYGLDENKNADKIIINRIRNIMSGTNNTTYHVIQWNTANYVAKTAEVAQTGNIAVENSLVAAAPLAPAVKGLNRNVVAVELKSAGDVKVSIVGVNGAVIANVSEKNLQAGVHQIKWNAGMAPSGRYVVKVEQNGMVNAKSVILK